MDCKRHLLFWPLQLGVFIFSGKNSEIMQFYFVDQCLARWKPDLLLAIGHTMPHLRFLLDIRFIFFPFSKWYCWKVSTTDNDDKLNTNVKDLTRTGWTMFPGEECQENKGGVRLQRVCGFLQILWELPFFFSPFAGRSIPIHPDRFWLNDSSAGPIRKRIISQASIP